MDARTQIAGMTLQCREPTAPRNALDDRFRPPSAGAVGSRLILRHRPRPARAKRFAPHGFTLVELLVVITIIGIMMALTLPAVMAAREGSRRVTCLNKMFQIGIGLNNYQSARDTLPPGTIDKRGPIRDLPQGYEMSWLTQILPYIGEEVIFQHIDFSVGAYDQKNAEVRSIAVANFLCPSACNSDNLPPVSNYAGCHNDLETPIDVTQRRRTLPQ